MSMLLAAAAAFLLLHLLVSGTRVRDALTGAIGDGPYMGLFSLASVALIVWLGFAYAGAARAGQAAVWWTPSAATKWIQLLVQLIAVFFIVGGLSTPNPTSVRQEATLDRPDTIKGMLRLTRHPFLWGAALWGAGHLMVRGDAPSIVLFGSILILAVLGTFSIDAKRKRTLGARWAPFAAATSNIPFAAIAAGRQRLAIGEIGAARIVLALAVWAGLVFTHPLLFGVSPIPGR
ncbi:MAG TPA: NnrU family protein [Caulobacteraceae bacterium]|nr:NnrU family protein [Caulobacteraceae bacterium]